MNPTSSGHLHVEVVYDVIYMSKSSQEVVNQTIDGHTSNTKSRTYNLLCPSPCMTPSVFGCELISGIIIHVDVHTVGNIKSAC